MTTTAYIPKLPTGRDLTRWLRRKWFPRQYLHVLAELRRNRYTQVPKLDDREFAKALTRWMWRYFGIGEKHEWENYRRQKSRRKEIPGTPVTSPDDGEDNSSVITMLLMGISAAALWFASKVNDTTRTVIQRSLNVFRSTGQTVKQLVTSIGAWFTNPSRAKRIAEDVSSDAYHRGRLAVAQGIERSARQIDQPPPGLPMYLPRVVYEWRAILDNRVCPICKSLDGQTRTAEGWFVISAGAVTVMGRQIKAPPVHSRCRCVLMITYPDDLLNIDDE